MDRIEFTEMLIQGWNAPFVARSETGKFTGEALSGRTVANEESRGNKVPGRVKIGRKVAYPTRNFAWWIATRMLKPSD